MDTDRNLSERFVSQKAKCRIKVIYRHPGNRMTGVENGG